MSGQGCKHGRDTECRECAGELEDCKWGADARAAQAERDRLAKCLAELRAQCLAEIEAVAHENDVVAGNYISFAADFARRIAAKLRERWGLP